MNPAQLLNPKAFAKERAQKRSGEHGPNQPRRPPPPGPYATGNGVRGYNPRPLSNNSIAAISSSSSSMYGEPHNGIAHGGGAAGTNQGGNGVVMSNFLDKFHNTQERDAVGHLRQQHPETNNGSLDADKRNAGFAGQSSNGGIIGGHMKEERKKMAAEARPQHTAPIDLTQDKDDDEVVFMGAKTDKTDAGREVCLGVLKCQGNASRVPDVGSSNHNAHLWGPMRVGIVRAPARDTVIEFTDRKSHTFARLDFQSAAALAPLMDGSQVNKLRMKAYLDGRPRKDGETVGAATSQKMNFSMHLYAPHKKAEQIGKYLSQKQLFLELPKAVEPGKEIYNPHVPQAYRERPIGAPNRTTAAGAVSYVDRTIEQTRRDVSTMFSELPKSEELPEKEVDDQIVATPLMAHQKKALHFLVDHESHDETVVGGVSNKSKFSLWKEETRMDRSSYWHNVITGHEVSEKPASVYGGILADMMGLGKTLSILSLIAATTDDSERFRIKRPAQELLDGGNVERNAKGTLIVCPKSVLSNWTEQVQAHIRPGTLSLYTYHGNNRTQDIRELSKYDIVLTSYGTVAKEVGDALKKKRSLISLQWFRLVLDEAHMIRNANTLVSKGACGMAGQRRWAVTGTPVQNSLNDLGALIRFLRIKPFDEPSSWAQYITTPFKHGDAEVLAQLKLLVAGVTLRREKDNIGLKGRVEKIVRLEFTHDERRLYSRFAGQSNMQLKSMMRDTNNTLRGKSYAHVLKSLLRLRMICDHGREMLNEDDLKDLEGMDPSNAIDLGDEPDLEPNHRFVSERSAYELLHMQHENDMDLCARCSKQILSKKDSGDDVVNAGDESSSDEDENDDTVGALNPCYHVFCAGCKAHLIATTIPPNLRLDGYHECQVCSAYVRFEFVDLTRSGYQTYLDEHTNQGKKTKRQTWTDDSYSGPHTKVAALLAELAISAQQTAALPEGEPPIRSVVFSEWTSYLDLISHALSARNIGYVRLDGKMNVRARSAAIATFRSDPSILVMIVSIRAGGQGLNFTAANKVYMMEPQFNPGVEQQAIDRVHRLGQLRDVEIVHFVMESSVEEALLKLQEKKLKLASLSMEKKMTRAEEAKQKMEELRELFK